MPNVYGLTGQHIVITGGAGFIGSTLASKLVDDNRITIYDNFHNDAIRHTALGKHPNVELIRGDVLDPEGLKAAFKPSVNYVIHCAAIAGVTTVLDNPLKTLEVNMFGVYHVLNACVGLPDLKRFVDFSTSEVFGQYAFNVDESVISPTVRVGEARWTYSISKLAGEFIAHSFHKMHKIPTVTIRPFNVYGPNQVGVGAIHNFVTRAIKGEDLVIHNDGSQIRAWVYIDDFVHGVLLAMLKGGNGKSYNIGNPRAVTTIEKLARMAKEAAGSNSKLVYQQVDYPDVDIRIPNIRNSRTDLGFEPQFDLEEGVARTVAWYRQKLAQQAAERSAA